MLNSQQSPSSQQKHTPNRSPEQNNSHSYFIFDDLTSALSERNNNNNNSLNNNNNNHNSKNLINSSNDNIMAKLNQINNHSSSSSSSAVSAVTSSSIMSALKQPPQFQNRFQFNSTSATSNSNHSNSNTFQNQSANFQHFNNFSSHHSTVAAQQMQQQQQKSGFASGSGSTTGTETSASTNYHFKTLVPSVAAGAIIGKGGETIASLQKDAGARVKMSKAHDFYPGTTERVCLISGTIEGIMAVLDFIIDKIKEKPDLTKALTEADAKQAQERDKQVKVLVPNSTAGMIIGKAGAYIKQIKEESGSYVQISQKPKDLTLQERCITIIGEKEHNKTACRMILQKIIEDPSSGSCLNVSYADVSGPVANFNPTGSPFAAQQNPNFSSSTASLNSALSTAVGGGTGMLVNGTGINLSLNLGAPTPQTNPSVTTQLLDHIKIAMRGSGYSDSVTTEVVAALGILAKYGVLGIGVGLSNGAHTAPLSFLGVQTIEQSANAAASGVYGAIGQVNLDQYIHGTGTTTPRTSLERYEAFDPFRHAGSQAATPISLNNNSFGLTSASAQALNAAAAAQTLGALSKSPTPAEINNKDSKNVEIPEVIVGAILGPAGRSLIEIQHLSGANVQISKKGTFAPGTRNRIVTITGQPNAINMAHYLIEQRITEEETKRACQNKTTGATTVTQ